MRIKVDHQLQRTAQMQYVIEEPKTDKGIRYVPMTEAVAACFRRIIANRKTPKLNRWWKGYAGFLFLDKTICRWLPSLGEVHGAYHSEIQQDLPYPDAESYPHVCRHTFCSKWQNRYESEKPCGISWVTQTSV